VTCFVDGELVCLDADGRPDFHRLRRRLSAGDARSAASVAVEHPATLIVFDVLHLDGQGPVRGRPRVRTAAARYRPVARLSAIEPAFHGSI
jgi:ATP-dependent DNA ligase